GCTVFFEMLMMKRIIRSGEPALVVCVSDYVLYALVTPGFVASSAFQGIRAVCEPLGEKKEPVGASIRLIYSIAVTLKDLSLCLYGLWGRKIVQLPQVRLPL